MPWTESVPILAVEHAAGVLDFGDWLSRVAARACLGRSRETLAALAPISNRALLARRRKRVAAWLRLLEDGLEPDLTGMEDPAGLISRARREGSRLIPEELYRVATVLLALGRFQDFLRARGDEAAPLPADLGPVASMAPLASSILAAVGPEGEVLDSASLALARIRRGIGEARDRVRGTLDQLIRDQLSEPGRDVRPTFRNGRPVLPVRRDERARLPGIVHDESGTGRTLFVEPLATVELNNRVTGLTAEEREEIERILDALTESLRQAASEIESQVDRFHRLEVPLLIAREFRGRRRSWAEEKGSEIRLVQAAHPLLAEFLPPEMQLVPLDLHLPEDLSLLLVTGPNTGGKTVMLKTLGLMVFLNQIGAPLPAGDGCVLPIFDRIFASIGDEQSLQDSRSTFSAHLHHLVRMVDEAGPGTLILVDEIGDGTDPDEGTALGRAAMEHWIRADARALVTTHFSVLKGFAQETEGAANAAMEFDPQRKRPLYTLRFGVPGSSRAMATARRLGLDEGVLTRAEELLGREALRMDALLTQLEEETRSATVDREEAAAHRRRYERLEEQYGERMAAVKKEERRILAESRRESEQFLAESRRELEAVVKAIREAQADRESITRGREALGRLEKEMERRRPGPEGARPLGKWRAGDRARMVSTGRNVEILGEAGEGRLRVSLDGLSLVLPLGELSPLTESEKSLEAASRPGESWDYSAPAGELESFRLDLRGMTVEEALDALDGFLDQAQLGGYEFVEILHGKGTGALRQAVHGVLSRDGRVKAHRLADQNRGGTGVTRADLASY